MTLRELLPSIWELSEVEKQELRSLLDRELQASPEQDTVNGSQLVELCDRRFGHLEPFELEIPPREPARIDETLFAEFEEE